MASPLRQRHLERTSMTTTTPNFQMERTAPERGRLSLRCIASGLSLFRNGPEQWGKGEELRSTSRRSRAGLLSSRVVEDARGARKPGEAKRC